MIVRGYKVGMVKKGRSWLIGAAAAAIMGSVTSMHRAGAAGIAVAVPGYAGYRAVAVAGPQPAVAVEDSSGVIWQQTLPGAVVALHAPGPHGLFDLRVNRDTVAAFVFNGKTVQSAVEGVQGGILRGDEGVSLGKRRIVVRSRDTAHQGSVAYRIVATYVLRDDGFIPGGQIRVPDYAPGQYPVPNAVVTTRHGDTILIRLEIASTEQQRETGLMYRKSLDPDSGMLFVWDSPVLESFWMENTYIPLSVAFMAPDGRVQEIQDMAPLTTVSHTPSLPYQYALEVNQGFFAANGIQPGDRLKLTLQA